MGLFEKIFPKTAVNEVTGNYFQTLNAYTPVFSSFSGGIYEAEMCRTCIHTFATHVSRLNFNSFGAEGDKLDGLFRFAPNQYQTTSQFLYRLATTLEVVNTAFIIPILTPDGKHIEGIYAADPMQASVKEYKDSQWIEFRFPAGTGIVELNKVGILTKYQYKSDFFGDRTDTLRPDIELINTINQGISSGVKSSANIRFLAKIATVLKDKSLQEARRKFVEQNLNSDNNGGVLMYDAAIEDVKQIESRPLVVDPEQTKRIQENVYKHFGTNEDIIMNRFTEEQWNAYYSGKILPFANQLTGVIQKMFMTEKAILNGSGVMVSDTRLDHASMQTKISSVTQLFDRGMMSQNEGRRVFGLPEIEDGDKYYIRKEYAESDRLNEAQGLEVINGE